MSTLPTSAPQATGESQLGRLIICRVDELHPHPGYVRHRITVPAAQLSLLAESGDLVFREPLTITRDCTILDGYARWQLALQQGRQMLPCLEYDLPEAEALHWLLQRHRRSNGLNDFSRILLAQDLERLLREQARLNQQLGGQRKGWSNLTEADRLDVRSKIAAAAGVSVGNVSKVKQLLSSSAPQLLDALRCDEVSIHRAWKLSKLPVDKQLDALGRLRIRKREKGRIQKLLSKHIPKSDPAAAHLRHLNTGLTGLKTIACLSCIWEQIDALLTAIEHAFHNKRSHTNAD